MLTIILEREGTIYLFKSGYLSAPGVFTSHLLYFWDELEILYSNLCWRLSLPDIQAMLTPS